MIFYNHSVDLPFTKKKLVFREINTEEQLFLAKANFSHSNDKESLYDYFLFVKKIIENCLENKNILNEINVIEYILFLVKLRILSIGLNIDLLLKQKNKTKIQLNLKNYLLNLYKASEFLEKEENNLIQDKNIEIKLNWPFLNSLEFFSKMILENKNEYEMFTESIQEYIEYIKIKNKKISLNNFNTEEKIKLTNNLNLKIKNKIQEKIIEALKILVTSEVFDVSTFKTQKFNFYNLSFIEHLKLFFSSDVKTLYQEIYILSSCHLNPEYIMKISPSERKVYFSIIQEQRKSQEKSSGKVDFLPTGNNISSDLEKLAAEFGDLPPQ